MGRHLTEMPLNRRQPPVIDMRLDGTFPPPGHSSVPMRIAGMALTIAVIAGLLAVAGLVLWLLLWAILVLVPIAIVAALIGWASLRYQAWRKGSATRDTMFRR